MAEASDTNDSKRRRRRKMEESTFVQLMCPSRLAAELKWVSERNLVDQTQVIVTAVRNLVEYLEMEQGDYMAEFCDDFSWGSYIDDDAMQAAEDELVFQMRSELYARLPSRKDRSTRR